jgi:hypothetical protein
LILMFDHLPYSVNHRSWEALASCLLLITGHQDRDMAIKLA